MIEQKGSAKPFLTGADTQAETTWAEVATIVEIVEALEVLKTELNAKAKNLVNAVQSVLVPTNGVNKTAHFDI